MDNSLISIEVLRDSMIAKAATGSNDKVEVGVGIPGSSETSYNYHTYIKTFYNFSLDLGFTLTVLMITYAGFRYITSAGNQTTINEAKEIILGALLGFAMLYLIKFILNFIGLPNEGISGLSN